MKIDTNYMSDIRDRLRKACQGASYSAGGLNVTHLKDLLRKRGLSTAGKRKDLLDRLCRPEPARPIDIKATLADFSDKHSYDRYKRLPALLPHGRQEIFLCEKFLKHMSSVAASATFETGGLIDLDERGIFEKAAFRIGEMGSVDLLDLGDFEVTYHVHPYRPDVDYEIPSVNDIYNSNHNHHQVDIVFAPDAVYCVYNINATAERPVLQGTFDRHDHGSSDNYPLTNYDRAIDLFDDLEKLGYFVIRHAKYGRDSISSDYDTWSTRVPIFVEPIEPIKI